MSTLGKVLTALIIVAIIGWMVELSLIAERNSNWGKLIIDLRKEHDARTEEIPPIIAQADTKREEARVMQDRIDKFRAVFRNELAALQRFESNTKEEQMRVQLQLQNAETATKLTLDRYQTRLKEKNDLWDQLEREKATTQEAIAENSRLRAELKSLQDQFLKTTAENKTLSTRLSKPTPSSRRESSGIRVGSLDR